MDSPDCNDPDTDWYVRVPTDAPLADPKDEMLLKLCERENVILEQIPIKTDDQFPI